MPRDNLYLAEIVEAIDRITRWLEGIDEHGWDGDEMRRAAVLQQLTTIGEASRGVRGLFTSLLPGLLKILPEL